MNWVTILWSLAAGASTTLAVTHGLIWLKDRTRHADLAFAVTAFAITAIAGCELATMSAPDPKTFGKILRWAHVPVMVMLVALICFVRLYFQTGRLWLAGLAIAEGLVTIDERNLAGFLDAAVAGGAVRVEDRANVAREVHLGLKRGDQKEEWKKGAFSGWHGWAFSGFQCEQGEVLASFEADTTPSRAMLYSSKSGKISP